MMTAAVEKMAKAMLCADAVADFPNWDHDAAAAWDALFGEEKAVTDLETRKMLPEEILAEAKVRCNKTCVAHCECPSHELFPCTIAALKEVFSTPEEPREIDATCSTCEHEGDSGPEYCGGCGGGGQSCWQESRSAMLARVTAKLKGE